MENINNENILSIKNLSKQYGKNNFALNNVDLELKKGKIIGLLGPNGAGKTTLLKILSGMSLNYTGDVLIDNQKIGIETKKIVAYLPDSDFFDPMWKVKYALEYYNDFFDDFDLEKAKKLINILDIDYNKQFSKLSKGNREKLQLILTLSRNAKLYLFDEPIAGVDPAARELIFKLILDNCAKDSTILISTHLISEVEQVLDDFVFIKKGKVVRVGNVKETIEKEGKSINDLFKEEFSCLKDY